MNGRYNAWMNGIELQSIDELLLLTGVMENAPTMAVTTAAKLNGGTVRMNAYRQQLTVKIGFTILSYDAEIRKDICRRVYQWAKSGYLEISDRPNQRLKVVCDTPPVMDTGGGASDEYTLTVTAYEQPYWESLSLSLASGGSAASQTVNMTVLGDVDTLLRASVTADEAITTLTVSTEDSTVAFTSLTAAAGSTIAIGYTDEGYLTATVDGESAYSNLTIASDDVLLIPAGTSTVTITASGAVTPILSARGRFE